MNDSPLDITGFLKLVIEALENALVSMRKRSTAKVLTNCDSAD